jgi:hypothetical protein
MMGAAYTTIISFILAAVLAYAVVQKYYPLQVEHRRIITLFLLAILIFWGAASITGISENYQLLLKGVLVILFPVILYPLKFYHVDEINKMKEIINRMMGRD